MPTGSIATEHARVARIEVRPSEAAGDPEGERVRREAAAIGEPIESVRTAKVYLIEPADNKSVLDAELIDRIVRAVLADPVAEVAMAGATEDAPDAAAIEVHPLPGVMDPAAGSVRDALRELLGVDARVSTGRRYELVGATADSARRIADRLLANPTVSGVHAGAHWPDRLPVGTPRSVGVREVALRGLGDAELATLSRSAHLFLSPDEMRAIRDEYERLGREPTDIELETLAQTWSEHCVHKTLKSTIRCTGDAAGLDFSGRPGHTVNADGSVTIDNLLRSTVAAATHELIEDGLDWTLSVFVDNAGIVAFDNEHAVCVKVETHNHPSALEPYGGAATGIGGCIRDIIGTGMAAKPIASTDVFCVAPPDAADVPKGCIHPKRVLSRVVEGVRDYGNRMGIPTLNGLVWFDERYVGNPLVFCGCVGVMPRGENDALISGEPRAGDLIVAIGGRTGRDGIHGATFSSAELTEGHADEFAHAVQIGNPIEQKRLLDAILRARDATGGPLFSAITDCGAGGFSSAIGEMGERLGAEVHLERAPLKYEGLTPTEIWISEAQERMVLAVPPESLDALRAICDEEHAELSTLGTFGTPDRELLLNCEGETLGRLPMAFVHDGLPTPQREATWTPPPEGARAPGVHTAPGDLITPLLGLLAHPNIASKRDIVRQYDHEVQGNTVGKPLVGPMGEGPSDAAVIEPVPGSGRGLAIACGLATHIGDPARGGDPYRMALAAIDECVRNLVCAGADPSRAAILDNFCWPSCAKPENLGALVRAAEGCYDGAKAYRTPFVSGKDSLNNQFTADDGRTIAVPPTLLITGIAPVPTLDRVVTSDAKSPGNALVLVGEGHGRLRGSHYGLRYGDPDGPMPQTDLRAGPAIAASVHGLIKTGLVRSAHDVSDGGLLVAVAEMLIGSGPSQSSGALGASIELPGKFDQAPEAFEESPTRYVLEIEPGELDRVRAALGDLPMRVLGELDAGGTLRVGDESVAVAALAEAWLGGLRL